MKITNLERTEKIKVDMEGARNAFKQIPISKENGSPNFAFRVFTIEPDGHTPYHDHPFEHLNYIIEGKGAIVIEGNEENQIQKGDFVLILPGEIHQYVNKSKNEPLVLICAVPKEYE